MDIDHWMNPEIDIVDWPFHCKKKRKKKKWNFCERVHFFVRVHKLIKWQMLYPFQQLIYIIILRLWFSSPYLRFILSLISLYLDFSLPLLLFYFQRSTFQWLHKYFFFSVICFAFER
jgi:hypothetical protein